MYQGKLITLDNGEEYIIITELIIRGRRFVLGVSANETNDNTDEETLIAMEIVSKNTQDILVPLEDEKEAEAVTKLLVAKARDDAEKEDI